MNPVRVVVIGTIHHNTLGVIRSLGEAGIIKENISVLLVGEHAGKKNIISSSKYVSKTMVFSVNNYSEVVNWLLENKRKKSVIICCSDGAAETVINAKEQLYEDYKIPDTVLSITDLTRKSYQAEIAKKCGLLIPRSVDFTVSQPVEWDTFPCIIKPYKSTAGAGKEDVRIFNSKGEFVQSLASLGSDIIQIQQYIDKEMEYQLIGCSLEAGQTIIIPGFTKMIRQPKNTNTGYLLYSPIDKLIFDRECVEKFIRTIGYSGLFSVEFIRAKNGKDYFLEINMRNDGNAYCVESAGVNLPYIWTYYQAYGHLPEAPVSFSEQIYFIPDFNDLKIALKEIGLLKWLQQFRKAQSHSIYNKKDMGPFRFEFCRQVKRTFLHHK